MTKMNHEHVNAISQATTACLLHIEGNCSPVFKRVMQKQADRLTEARKFIEVAIETPDFDSIAHHKVNGIFELKDQKPNGTKPRQGLNRIR